jgi:16S rRNA (adenine1518-N6/adenine1519-N6)-dimethyltransferase
VIADEHPSAGPEGIRLLGPADVRQLAAALDVRPAKQRGQNFVIDANTIRRIVRAAGLRADDVVLEIGPGLGSLTLGLLGAAAYVVTVEIDEALAAQLPKTVATYASPVASRLTVVTADALRLDALPDPQPTSVVANLPYNVAVPVLLSLLERFPTIDRGLVMVQLEVADRLVAPPGSKVYGVPSAKLAWYADARRSGLVGRTVFWPQPRVDSGLVSFLRHAAPVADVDRKAVFTVVDAAFSQRRKTLRAALSSLVGSASAAEEALRSAGVDPSARGEQLTIVEFARIAGELT